MVRIKNARAPWNRDVTPGGGVILVTGAAGNLGRVVLRHLHRMAKVLAVDRRPIQGVPRDVEPFQIDIRRNRFEDIFRNQVAKAPIEAVVHLGILHDLRAQSEEHQSYNVIGTHRLLECCQKYQVPKVVFLSSSNVYGPRAHNPHFLTEDAALLAAGRFEAMRDLVEVDMFVQSFFWKRPDIETVVLRPVHILGSVKNAASNYLRLKRVPTLLGFDPMVQAMHEEDVARAIRAALTPGIRGVFNIAGPEPVPLSTLIRAGGKEPIPMPHPILRAALARMWPLRLSSFPAAELDFIRFVCLVDTTAAQEKLGYRHHYGLEETARSLNYRHLIGAAA